MSEEVFIKIKPNGEWSKCRLREETIQVADQVLAAVAETTPKRCLKVMPVGNALASVAIVGNQNYWTIPLTELVFVAPFRMVGEFMVPNFSSKTDPVLTIAWPVPPEIRLRLLCRLGQNGNCDVIWLLAFSADGNCWRLPIANIFEDCRLCHGQEYGRATSQLDALTRIVEDFRKSPWNADLWNNPERTQQMLRFKPNGKVFDVVPMERVWTSYCDKVSIESQNYASV